MIDGSAMSVWIRFCVYRATLRGSDWLKARRYPPPVPIDREHRLGPAGDLAHRARLAVDSNDPLKRLQRLELREPEHARAGGLRGAIDGQRQGVRFAPAIRVHHDVVGEQREQTVYVAASSRSIKVVEELRVLPAGRAEAWAPHADALPRPPQ